MVGISLEFLQALWIHSSHPCLPASQTLPSLGSAGTPPASREKLGQPRDAHGFIPRSSSNALSRCDLSGLQLATELPISAGHCTQTTAWRPAREDGLSSTRKGVSSTSPALTHLWGRHCVYGDQARAVPTTLLSSPHCRRPCRATGKRSIPVSW